MNTREREAVSILDSVLDWLCETGDWFGPEFPGLEQAKGRVARARELIVLEGEDVDLPEIKKDSRK